MIDLAKYFGTQVVGNKNFGLHRETDSSIINLNLVSVFLRKFDRHNCHRH